MKTEMRIMKYHETLDLSDRSMVLVAKKVLPFQDFSTPVFNPTDRNFPTSKGETVTKKIPSNPSMTFRQ